MWPFLAETTPKQASFLCTAGQASLIAGAINFARALWTHTLSICRVLAKAARRRTCLSGFWFRPSLPYWKRCRSNSSLSLDTTGVAWSPGALLSLEIRRLSELVHFARHCTNTSPEMQWSACARIQVFQSVGLFRILRS